MRNLGLLALFEVKCDLGQQLQKYQLCIWQVFLKIRSQGNNTLSLVTTSAEAATLGIRLLWIIRAKTVLSWGKGQGEE